MKILFMCVANSARSQLAEGLAKNLLPADVQVYSAGSNPSQVNPLAIEVLGEWEIDISRHHSKTLQQLPPKFLENLDYVITLCQEEVCPHINSTAKKLAWPLPDPAGSMELSKHERIELFRQTRQAIKEKIINLKNDLSL